MRHVGREAHHRHDEEAQVREVVRERVAQKLDDVEVVASRRQGLLRHEGTGVEHDGKEQHRDAARKEDEGSVFSLQDGPSHEDEHDASENDAGHESLLVFSSTGCVFVLSPF